MLSRNAKTAIVCGALALVGIAAPFALGHDQAQAGLVSLLRGIGAIGFICGLVLLFRTSGEEAPIGDEVYTTPPAAPRTLDSDPLGSNAAPIEQRIESAVEASKRFGRTFGLIYFNLDLYRQVAKKHGLEAADEAMNAVVTALRPKLRNTDRVERMEKGRILVCIVLLPEKKALESICNRMEAAMHALTCEALRGMPIVADVGMSIYPIGGYNGEDLIASARARCDTARSERIHAETRKRRAIAAAAKRAQGEPTLAVVSSATN